MADSLSNTKRRKDKEIWDATDDTVSLSADADANAEAGAFRGFEIRGIEPVPLHERSKGNAFNNLTIWWSVGTVVTYVRVFGSTLQTFCLCNLKFRIKNIAPFP